MTSCDLLRRRSMTFSLGSQPKGDISPATCLPLFSRSQRDNAGYLTQMLSTVQVMYKDVSSRNFQPAGESGGDTAAGTFGGRARPLPCFRLSDASQTNKVNFGLGQRRSEFRTKRVTPGVDAGHAGNLLNFGPCTRRISSFFGVLFSAACLFLGTPKVNFVLVLLHTSQKGWAQKRHLFLPASCTEATLARITFLALPNT